MPIFGSKKETEPLPPPEPVKTSRNPFKKEPEPPPQPIQEPRRSGNFFNRRRSSSPSTRTPTSPTSTRSHGLLHREKDDPSIIGARKRVADAENAEREADRALHAARASVNSAREEVKRLEREAAEEARRAQIKQKQAGEIVASAKSLGRK